MSYLEMKNISKTFGSVVANENVNFSVEKGEIHAILGENGAGKSTLMNILYGMYQQTSGDVFINGEKIITHSPKDAIQKGIGMVHQHFMLIPTLTVIENVILGYENDKLLDLNKSVEKFVKMAKEYNMEIDPFEKVSNLSVGKQQRLEILKALYRNAKILILDEPTAVLTPSEARDLFKVMRELSKKGHTIIFISHKLNEIMEICDRLTVLRLGKVEATMNISDVTSKEHLAKLMVGQGVSLTIEKSDHNIGENVLKIKNLNYYSHKKVKTLTDINLTVSSGEILGVCGVDGNGQSELVKCITGYNRKRKDGSILINQKEVINQRVKNILKQKVSHIPEDRQVMGIVSDMNLVENYMIMCYDEENNSKFGFINYKKLKEKTKEICEKYNVRTSGILAKISTLSGGNQQKLVVGREFERNPKLLIAVHPDRGLDIGATKFIQNEIITQRDKGAAVLLVSAELDEILELSDRIIVMYDGKIIDTCDAKKATKESLGMLMAGIK